MVGRQVLLAMVVVAEEMDIPGEVVVATVVMVGALVVVPGKEDVVEDRVLVTVAGHEAAGLALN